MFYLFLSIFTTEDIREGKGKGTEGRGKWLVRERGKISPVVSDEPSRPRTSVQPTAFEAATLASTISKSTTPTPPPTSLSTVMWLLLLLQLLLLRSGLWPWPLSNKTVSEGEREKLRAPEWEGGREESGYGKSWDRQKHRETKGVWEREVVGERERWRERERDEPRISMLKIWRIWSEKNPVSESWTNTKDVSTFFSWSTIYHQKKNTKKKKEAEKINSKSWKARPAATGSIHSRPTESRVRVPVLQILAGAEVTDDASRPEPDLRLVLDPEVEREFQTEVLLSEFPYTEKKPPRVTKFVFVTN